MGGVYTNKQTHMSSPTSKYEKMFTKLTDS